MDDTTRETLLARFGAYLETLEEQRPQAPAQDDDQFSLFVELAGLKSEVKREARQIKEAMDQFRSVFDTLQADNETLRRSLADRREVGEAARRASLRPLLLELLDLRDRLAAGVDATLPAASWWGRRFNQRRERAVSALREGQAMSLRRLDRLLADQQVRPMDTVGQPLDPHTMRVVEVAQQADQPPGVVLRESRKGFYWQDDCLRAAEVVANKPSDN